MGTRAAFWLGDPRDLENREWLGCLHWDGFPDRFAILQKASTAELFREAVYGIFDEDGDAWKPPEKWPYPWDDDIFLTDFTYAFFGGATYVTCFHHGFETLSQTLEADREEDDYDQSDDPTLLNVPAPEKWSKQYPGMILIKTPSDDA